MSDGTTPTIDPRFDPRFQRGYVPDASSPARGDHATPAGTRAVSSARADAAGLVAEAAADDAAGDVTTDDPAAAILDLLEYSEAERLVSADRDGPAVAGFAPAAPVDAEPADAKPADAEPADGKPTDAGLTAAQPATPALSGVDLEPDDGPVWSATRWLWIAIGACLVFVVVGSVLYWIQTSDPAMFTGIGSRGGVEETTRMVVTALSPALVQAGVLGIVAVLVAWALRGARHAERRR